ncbi:ribosomal protein S12 methylthiotransferase accessory factor [Streptosporangium becharense]|uniref:Ribosomal protein S12 methylthiotransferase accessory factor n=1 Tax=Streptosporangium becharense TaxID=1816182 RepID=A0A7W9MG99_9ACTN|nr:YcaO-like family protein [Streptosporangium becharense]MBB2909821.1 ribosomal protein S12 methylthiotransferase accessory factor [Streptosporangium becharense]MBB5819224.1 ribosomal protein S12 methylthiotransferase accessory factor [Streptosporangium becharense]
MDLLDLWADLVDPRTGIVREITELRIDDDDPRFVHYLSEACSTEAMGFLKNFGNNGGAATDRRRALAKAIGEAVERYCSACFSPGDLVTASYEELDRPATPPGSYALYRPEQYDAPGFPWRPFTPASRVSWTPGRSLVTGEEVLVPAAFVYVPYHYRSETPIGQPISTGLACGASAEEAALSALCEVVERDAFTLMWQGRRSLPRIRLDSLPDSLSDLVRRFEAVGLVVHMVDIGTDIGCPSVMTIAEGFTPTSPALAFAAASHPDAEVACHKSLEELAHTRKFSVQVMDYLPPVPVEVEAGHPAVDGQRAHLRYYCPQESKEYARFAWACTDEVDLDLSAGRDLSLAALVSAVAATGEDVVACDLTTPDVAELGLSVVRVVVPGLHPLHMGHSNRATGGRRLAAVPGWSPATDNPHPHPFP